MVGVNDPRVLDALRIVRRAAFVPPDYAESACDDKPIPIPHEQVTTQPSLSARMVQDLRLTGDERVLEIGAGYGYRTALLARLAAFVTPYDAVLVSAAFPQVPRPLVDQLRPGGRLVQPIGPGGDDQVILFERTPEGLVERERLLPARFVRLYGRHGYQ